jgi:hypothetical protein
MRLGAGRLVFAFALTLCAAEAHDASAQPKRPPPKKPAAEIGPLFTLTPELVQKLKSGDEAQARAALDDVKLAGKAAAAAVPAVSDLLANGASANLTEAALDTLGEIESPAGSAAIAPYATHRNLKVRRAAVRALVRAKGPVAAATLRRALSDPDPQVRGLSATGLGSMKAKEATGDLVVALDHKIPEAAASVGQLCATNECDELLARVGKLPFDVITTGLDQVLFRAPEEIPDDYKIKVIGRVRELGTLEANKFLHDVQTRWPKNWSARIRQAIDQAVLATSGGAQ